MIEDKKINDANKSIIENETKSQLYTKRFMILENIKASETRIKEVEVCFHFLYYF